MTAIVNERTKEELMAINKDAYSNSLDIVVDPALYNQHKNTGIPYDCEIERTILCW